MLRIVTKNQNPHGNQDGPFQVALAVDRRVAQLGHQAVVGFRVGKSRSGWYAQPLCGPLAPTVGDMSERTRSFANQREAMQYADAEIRRWCGQMAQLFGNVEAA